MLPVINALLDNKPAQKVLRQLQATGRDFSGLFADIGEYLKLSHRLRFDEAEAPDGTKWKENSPVTPKYGINKPLHGKTLNLRDGFVYQASAHSLDFGPGQPTKAYAAIHHFGGIIKPKNGKALAFKTAGGDFRMLKQVTITARPYLGLSETDERTILRKLTAEYQHAAQVR